jgi:hypothetical protein
VCPTSSSASRTVREIQGRRTAGSGAEVQEVVGAGKAAEAVEAAVAIDAGDKGRDRLRRGFIELSLLERDCERILFDVPRCIIQYRSQIQAFRGWIVACLPAIAVRWTRQAFEQPVWLTFGTNLIGRRGHVYCLHFRRLEVSTCSI